MKRYAVLVTFAITSVILLNAQEKQPTEMSGWICTPACITQTPGHAACDSSCAANDESEDTVFVSPEGKVSKISNPDMAKGKRGQQVRMKCQIDKDKQSMEIVEFLSSIQ
jgi:hypothetical protein